MKSLPETYSMRSYCWSPNRGHILPPPPLLGRVKSKIALVCEKVWSGGWQVFFPQWGWVLKRSPPQTGPQHYSVIFDIIRQYSTIFDIIRQYAALFDDIRHFWQYSTLFDAIQHFSTVECCKKCCGPQFFKIFQTPPQLVW